MSNDFHERLREALQQVAKEQQNVEEEARRKASKEEKSRREDALNQQRQREKQRQRENRIPEALQALEIENVMRNLQTELNASSTGRNWKLEKVDEHARYVAYIPFETLPDDGGSSEIGYRPVDNYTHIYGWRLHRSVDSYEYQTFFSKPKEVIFTGFAYSGTMVIVGHAINSSVKNAQTALLYEDENSHKPHILFCKDLSKIEGSVLPFNILTPLKRDIENALINVGVNIRRNNRG